MNKLAPRPQQSPNKKRKDTSRMAELPPLNYTSANIKYHNKNDNFKGTSKPESKTFSNLKDSRSYIN